MVTGVFFRLALLSSWGVVSVFTAGDRHDSTSAGKSDSAPALHDTTTGLPISFSPPAGSPSAVAPDTRPYDFVLFGQPIRSIAPPPPSDPSPSRPTGWHVTYPPLNQQPVLDRRLAGIMSANTVHATLIPVPGNTFDNPGVRARLKQWSQWVLSDHRHEFHYITAKHDSLEDGMSQSVYLFRPIPPEDFEYIFPDAVEQWQRVTPIAVYRARAPQQNFQSYGKFEISGVEMAVDMHGPFHVGVIPREPLGDLLDIIENPPLRI